MKILSLNVWNGGRLKDKISDFLLRYMPHIDVFCFQEAEPQGRGILTPLLDTFYEVEASKVAPHRFFQSTFVRNKFKILESDVSMKDNLETGLGLWSALSYGSGRLWMCNYHGCAYPGDKLDNSDRLRASDTLIMDGVEKGMPQIVLGDFNLNENTESVSMFERAGFRNLIKEYNIPTTRNHMAWDCHPEKQYHSDYVFVSPDIEVVDFVVLPDIVSDHQPLLLTIN